VSGTIDLNLTASAVALIPFERRDKNRVPVRIPVRIIGKSLVGEISQHGVCMDISESGVSFETNVDLYVGEMVELEFRQNDAGHLSFQVRLLYKAGNRYGGCFVSSRCRP
jgi:PilZ domain